MEREVSEKANRLMKDISLSVMSSNCNTDRAGMPSENSRRLVKNRQDFFPWGSPEKPVT